jgi:hypothetical protein
MPATTQHPKLFVLHHARRPKDLAEELRPGYEKRADAFGVSMENFYADFEAIRTSPLRTSSGKQQDVRSRSLAQLKEIHDGHRELDKLRDKINTALAQRPTSTEDPMLRYLRQRDAVRWVNAQEPLMHKSILNEADGDFVDLLATAPRYLGSKVDPSLITAARERVAEAANPEIGKLSQLLRAYEFLYNTAEQAVREAARSVGLVDLLPDAPRPPDSRKAFLVSTGKPAPEPTR